jgi:sRNA-binding carbon storage regulator CsrA
MLVLHRKANQRVMIGESIVVKVIHANAIDRKATIEVTGPGAGAPARYTLGARSSVEVAPAVTVTLADVTRGVAVLGVTAPEDVGIWREEVLLRIRREGMRR